MHSFARCLPAPGLFCLLGIFMLISNQMGLCAPPLPQAPVSKGCFWQPLSHTGRLTEGCESRNLHASSEIHETDRSKGMKHTAFVSSAPRRQCHKGINLSPKGPTFMTWPMYRGLTKPGLFPSTGGDHQVWGKGAKKMLPRDVGISAWSWIPISLAAQLSHKIIIMCLDLRFKFCT